MLYSHAISVLHRVVTSNKTATDLFPFFPLFPIQGKPSSSLLTELIFNNHPKKSHIQQYRSHVFLLKANLLKNNITLYNFHAKYEIFFDSCKYFLTYRSQSHKFSRKRHPKAKRPVLLHPGTLSLRPVALRKKNLDVSLQREIHVSLKRDSSPSRHQSFGLTNHK